MSWTRFGVTGVAALAIVLLLLVSFCDAGVLWTANGVELFGTGVPNGALYPQITCDGSGGAIVTWEDLRGGSKWDIYVQGVNASGNIMWVQNGVELRGTGVSNDASPPQITSDGSGGAIVTWADYRSGSQWDIYARRVNASGTAQWTTNGVELRGTGVPSNASDPQITSDGSGGAIVTWADMRSGSQYEIYARRVSASGTVEWTANGVELRSTGVSNSAEYPQITPDGSGGAIVAWEDMRSGKWDIYARRISSSGTAQWAMNGVELRGTGISNSASAPQITSDGSGGAIVTWADYRGGKWDIYAQRVDAWGNIMWIQNGVELRGTGVSNDATTPRITSDGAGGAVVTWVDYRGGSQFDIYAQRVDASGNILWTANGVELRGTGVSNNAFNPRITPDGSGGAVVTWEDLRGGIKWDIYAQRVDAGGNILWTANGVELRGTGVSNSANTPQITSDGSGGAIVTWYDWRSSKPDIYAQRVAIELPTIQTDPASSVDWTGATLNGNITSTVGENADQRGFRYRKAGTGTWTNWTESGSFGTGAYSHPVSGLTPGTQYEYQATAHNSVGWSYGSTENFTTGKSGPDLSTWYLAEGSTDWGYSCYVTVENPNGSSVNVELTYQTRSGPVAGPAIQMPALSQATVNPADTLGATDFSTRVECMEGKTIAADRTMTWTGLGAASEESHCSVGVTSPDTTWYLPEGSTQWEFETWLLIQNPNGQEASCDVTYMIEGQGSQTINHKVPANSRESYSMAADIGAEDASIKVVADRPVIPERAMYRYNRREGHDSIGTTTPATDYYLAEGAVGYDSDYTTFVLVQNPQNSPTDVTITYLTGTGQVAGPSFQMDPNSRKTIRLNDQLPPATDVSTSVHGSQAIIAERAMYWNSSVGEACHDSIGMSTPAMTFYLPDGETSNGRETYTLVQNPNPAAVTVEVSYLLAGGGTPISFTEEIDANSRKTYNMADKLPSGRASILVESQDGARPIMCERAMYWDSRCAGTDTIGGFKD